MTGAERESTRGALGAATLARLGRILAALTLVAAGLTSLGREFARRALDAAGLTLLGRVMPASHSVMTLVPSHAEPMGHSRQPLRVVLLPPVVNEPGGHWSQRSASSALYVSSAPHSVQLAALTDDHEPARQDEHTGEPALAYVPAAHSVLLVVPSHAKPAGHAVHSTMPRSFGIQNVPSEHDTHWVSPTLSVVLPQGQSLHRWPGAAECFPRSQSLQSWRLYSRPAGQMPSVLLLHGHRLAPPLLSNMRPPLS